MSAWLHTVSLATHHQPGCAAVAELHTVGGEIVGGEIVGGEIVGGEIVGGEIDGDKLRRCIGAIEASSIAPPMQRWSLSPSPAPRTISIKNI